MIKSLFFLNFMLKDFPEGVIDNDLKICHFTRKNITNKYVSWLNDPEIVRFSEQRHFNHTIESCTDYFINQQKTSNLFLAIMYGNNYSIHIGNIGVRIDRFNLSADVSIIIGEKDYWGLGLGLRSWNIILDTLLYKMNFRVITAGTMEVNLPMIKLMRKSGMKISSVLPKRFLLDGEEIGLVLASKLNTQRDEVQ